MMVGRLASTASATEGLGPAGRPPGVPPLLQRGYTLPAPTSAPSGASRPRVGTVGRDGQHYTGTRSGFVGDCAGTRSAPTALCSVQSRRCKWEPAPTTDHWLLRISHHPAIRAIQTILWPPHDWHVSEIRAYFRDISRRDASPRRPQTATVLHEQL